MSKKKSFNLDAALVPVARTQRQGDYLGSAENRCMSAKAAGWLALGFSAAVAGVGAAFPEAQPLSVAASVCFGLAGGIGFWQSREVR